MLYRNQKKIVDKFKHDLNNLKNLTCELCNASYISDFELVEYCPDCIEKLQDQLNEEGRNLE